MSVSSSIKPISAIKKNVGGFFKYSYLTPDAKEVQLNLANDIYGCAIGPMPAEDFLNRFMPVVHQANLEVDKDFFSGLPTGCTETDMYQPFVS